MQKKNKFDKYFKFSYNKYMTNYKQLKCENKLLERNIAIRRGIRESQQIVRREHIVKRTHPKPININSYLNIFDI